MKNSLTYILGATVLVGGAYLFLKNKKAKDLAKLNEIGGATTGGTTSGGTTSGGTTSGDGVAPTDANLNLANATILATQRKTLNATANKSCITLGYASFIGGGVFGGGIGTPSVSIGASTECDTEKLGAKKQLIELDKKLATLGYKVDAIGQLVKI